MTYERLAWATRSIMIVVAAVATYLLVQTEIGLEPLAKVILGAVLVALAAINPSNVASKISTPG
jgi:uncharacterized membrane-anchored protein